VRKRLQIDLAPEAIDELEDLQEKTGLTSRADLIRYALRFLQWTVNELATEDAALLLRKNGETLRIAFPLAKRPRKEISEQGQKQALQAM
jgi:Arc/MetJ-type ribon-helix-helix transcriptional regulator